MQALVGPMYHPPRPRPVRLAGPLQLGDPGPGAIHVVVLDENGRAFPNVELAMVLQGAATGSETRNVGATGETVIDVRSLPAGGKVILTPKIPIDFVSDPPFQEVTPGEGVPSEVVFTVARRQFEKDYITPTITFIAGGLVTGVLLWGLDRLGVKL